MEADLDGSEDVKDLITTVQRMEWVMGGFALLCAALFVTASFVDFSGEGHYFFIVFLYVFLGFCFKKVRELAQVVERLDEKGKGETD